MLRRGGFGEIVFLGSFSEAIIFLCFQTQVESEGGLL